jgi:hypothetical protein
VFAKESKWRRRRLPLAVAVRGAPFLPPPGSISSQRSQTCCHFVSVLLKVASAGRLISSRAPLPPLQNETHRSVLKSVATARYQLQLVSRMKTKTVNNFIYQFSSGVHALCWQTSFKVVLNPAAVEYSNNPSEKVMQRAQRIVRC